MITQATIPTFSAERREGKGIAESPSYNHQENYFFGRRKRRLKSFHHYIFVHNTSHTPNHAKKLQQRSKYCTQLPEERVSTKEVDFS